MGLTYEIPGTEPIVVEHLLLDVNGTLTNRGELIDGVAERLGRLREDLSVALLSADTLGSLDKIAVALGVEAIRVGRGDEKRELVRERGPRRCAAIGNGANDATMLAAAALGIVVVGPEGAAARAVHAADVVCSSIGDALDLLLDPRAVASTLRP
jgi:soluble P-type ATPase